MDFFVNGCAGAWANGCRFHYLPWSRTTSDLSDFSVLIFDLVYSLQFCMWMGCLFYLAALRIIGGIMADVNELHSGEMHLFGSDELDRDSQVGRHENETFGSNSPCKYPENWTPCRHPIQVMSSLVLQKQSKAHQRLPAQSAGMRRGLRLCQPHSRDALFAKVPSFKL